MYARIVPDEPIAVDYSRFHDWSQSLHQWQEASIGGGALLFGISLTMLMHPTTFLFALMVTFGVLAFTAGIITVFFTLMENPKPYTAYDHFLEAPEWQIKLANDTKDKKGSKRKISNKLSAEIREEIHQQQLASTNPGYLTKSQAKQIETQHTEDNRDDWISNILGENSIDVF